MDFNKLSLGDKIVGGAGIVLLIDLLFFPWHSVDLGVFGTVTRSAIESPNAFWGWLALLVTLAVVVVVVLKRLTTVALPDLPIAWNQAIFFGTIAVGVLLLLKLISTTDFLGFGAWLGILFAAGMIYGGFLVSKQPEEATGTAGTGGFAPPPPPPPA